jgi:hypothetical protein
MHARDMSMCQCVVTHLLLKALMPTDAAIAGRLRQIVSCMLNAC